MFQRLARHGGTKMDRGLTAFHSGRRGHIIVMTSIAAREVYRLGVLYCATKHALSAIARGSFPVSAAWIMSKFDTPAFSSRSASARVWKAAMAWRSSKTRARNI